MHIAINSICLNLVSSLVELFPENLFQKKPQKYFFDLFKSYTTKPEICLRKNGCYGFGVLATAMKQDFLQYANESIAVLEIAFEMPQNQAMPQEMLLCKDYIKSSYGKIVNVCLIYGGNSNSEELMVWVMGWIEGLPLKKAVEEGYNQ